MYANNTTQYLHQHTASKLDVVLKRLKIYTIKIFECFHNNYNNRKKFNAGKCNAIANPNSPVETQLEKTSSCSY